MQEDFYKQYSKVKTFKDLKNVLNKFKKDVKLKFFDCLKYYTSKGSTKYNFKGTIYQILFQTPYNEGVYKFCKNFLMEIKFFEVVTSHSENFHLFLGDYLLENIKNIFPYYKTDLKIHNVSHNFIKNQLGKNKNERSKKLFLKAFGNYKAENIFNNQNYFNAEKNTKIIEIMM
jgi:hypothetical protein